MGRGFGSFHWVVLGFVFFLFASPSSYATDSYLCRDWMDLFGLQEMLVGFRQRKEEPPNWLRDAIAAKVRALEGEDVGDADDSAPWAAPAEDSSAYDGEAGVPAELAEFEDEPWEVTGGEEFGLGRLFDDLQEVVEREFHFLDPEMAIDAVWRRLLVDKLFNRPEVVSRLWYLGLMEPRDQEFALELWNRRLRRRAIEELPVPEELGTIANILALDKVDAIAMLRAVDWRPQTQQILGPTREVLREIVVSTAEERLGQSPEQLVNHLFERLQRNDDPNTHSFGRFLFNYLLDCDPLIEIHSVDSLKRIMDHYRFR